MRLNFCASEKMFYPSWHSYHPNLSDLVIFDPWIRESPRPIIARGTISLRGTTFDHSCLKVERETLWGRFSSMKEAQKLKINYIT